jgi:hypothetical protein
MVLSELVVGIIVGIKLILAGSLFENKPQPLLADNKKLGACVVPSGIKTTFLLLISA